MTHAEQHYSWSERVASEFPELSPSQQQTLADYSYGAALAGCIGLGAVALILTTTFTFSYHAIRERLRDWYRPASAKAGRGRTEVDPAVCFAPLLRWILKLLDAKSGQLGLALDATNLGERFHVLCCSITYRGCSIPVAWVILPGGSEEAWNPQWFALLERLSLAVKEHSDSWRIVVLTDRGLESRDLFNCIRQLGFHPLMRVKAGAKFRPEGWRKFYPLQYFVNRIGERYVGRGELYASQKFPCTLVAEWAEGHEEAWFLMTDLEPRAANPCWYAFRMWIERQFKLIKSAGWNWQRTQMKDADRANRIWVVVALATLWVVELGSLAEDEIPPDWLPKLPRVSDEGERAHSLFRMGLAIVCGLKCPLEAGVKGVLLYESWPDPEEIILNERQTTEPLIDPYEKPKTPKKPAKKPAKKR